MNRRTTSAKRLLVAIAALSLLTAIRATPLPASAALKPGTDPFERTWSRTDRPVADNAVSRTWMWGPGGFTATTYEPYAEAPGGIRVVQYFDKSRMEITNPSGDPSSPWYVTNGLIAREMITGELQVGDNSFRTREPATVNVAGDPDDTVGPTYETFGYVLNSEPFDADEPLITRISRDGLTEAEFDLADYDVTASEYVADTNHRVASVFWEFMTSRGTVWENGNLTTDSIFEDPYFGTGFPITEAYWATVKVANLERDVLVQCFQRRCLTYTPSNDPQWRVEMGNVGQHYFKWRYEVDVPADPPGITGSPLKLNPILLADWPVQNDGEAWLWIANQSPYEMTLQIDGPVSRTITLPPCPDCVVYQDAADFTECFEDLPFEETTLPPGNYRATISYDDEKVKSGAGYWTVMPDTDYASCYAVISDAAG